MTVTESFLAELAPQAYGWPESLRFTYDTTRRLLADGVPGDLVECGVANGVHPAAMARASADAGERRTVRLFDSFEGLPHCGPLDKNFQDAGHGDGSGRLESIGLAACGLTAVQDNLSRWGCEVGWFRFYPGWFQDTVADGATGIDAIAFLRLDGDLYESTLVCLQHLYPLVVSGGVVVVDDWDLDGCRQAVADYFRANDPDGPWKKMSVTHITESGDVWWTRP